MAKSMDLVYAAGRRKVRFGGVDSGAAVAESFQNHNRPTLPEGQRSCGPPAVGMVPDPTGFETTK
jgi:hypothetical protein